MSDTTSLNRETRRYAKKQGLLDDDGEPVRQQRDQRDQRRQPTEVRTGPADFVREVRKELKLVSWPTREEVINYSLIVFTLLVVFTGLVALLDFGLGEGVVALFER